MLLPLKDLPLEWVRVVGTTASLSIQHHEKTEGRTSDFAQGHLKVISNQMTFLLGLKELV